MQQACIDAHYFNNGLKERLTGISRISSVKIFVIPSYLFLKCYVVKFREILVGGSTEIGVFPRKLFRIELQFSSVEPRYFELLGETKLVQNSGSSK